MPSSLAGLVQTYYNKTATSLEFNALAGYPAHMVLLSFTKREKRYLVDHGHTLLGLLPAEAAELSERDGKQVVDEIFLCTGLHLQRGCLWRML